VERLFHITLATAWDEAQATGQYRQSTLGKTLDEEGFMHCSRREQVAGVANAVYQGHDDLLLLVIDAVKITAEVRNESVEQGGEMFPHIYGPLNLDAVVEVIPLRRGRNGRFAYPV
jgi:glutathione S-transferase